MIVTAVCFIRTFIIEGNITQIKPLTPTTYTKDKTLAKIINTYDNDIARDKIHITISMPITSIRLPHRKIKGMEENKRINTNKFKKRHFSKLHEKIQHKYDEMQKRIEKSKSVDAIAALNDDYRYTYDRHCSTLDLRQNDVYENQSPTQKAIVKEVVTRSAESRDVQRESVSEIIEEFMMVEKEDVEYEKSPAENENTFFGNDFYNLSVESLHDACGDDDGFVTAPPTPTPPPKISIRDRISLKISAAKEKRRKTENATKDKKKETREKVEKFILSNTTKQDIKINKKTKLATVTIALIEATDLEHDSSEEKPRFLFCRFRLGSEKYKSKLSKNKGNTTKWQELFNLSMYDENMLEISLWDKDVFVGRTFIDLLEFDKEKTHKLKLDLECDHGNVQLFILITISGIFNLNTLMDSDDYEQNQRRLSTFRKKYAWYHIKNDTDDVGWLSVIVYGAKGLIGNDYYCILELGNERVQTHTEFKTSDPNWMKIFTFPVNDITSILDLTIHDDKKSEDIGKVSIPLLNINNGEKKWFALKDITQRYRAKGNNPRVLLEMKVTWNVWRASVRVINPKETKYLETKERLHRQTFTKNLARARAVFSWITRAFLIVKSCFEWESRRSNVIALTIWLLFCYFFKMWMLPLLLLIPFIWYKPDKYHFTNWRTYYYKENELDLMENGKKEEKNTSLRQKFNTLQEMVQSVQNIIGKFASLGERIKNLFNFTVPFLSFLAIFIISIVALVMYLIPVQYIFMFWGIHKFTRKILRPNRIPNNEILDLLSRVPDDETLLSIQELPLEAVVEEDVIE